MKKILHLAGILTIVLATQVNAQKTDTIRDPEIIKQIVKESGVTNRNNLIKKIREDACNCIDAIKTSGKSSAQLAEEISKCISAQVFTYELLIQTAESLEEPGKNKVITMSTPGTASYNKSYYAIERVLSDSCWALTQVIANSNEESEKSFSKDPDALKNYEKGVESYKVSNYDEAIKYFKKAVKTDDQFAFAWDNLGICYRKIGKLDEALEAYTKSLSVNPFGRMPLQNIPIVYIYKKEYDKAIEGYNHLANIYPKDPETFYGVGNVLVNYKSDYENGLHNMCKAYNLYIELKSPYRVDAEKQINFIYSKMKEQGNEKLFFKILKEHNISPN